MKRIGISIKSCKHPENQVMGSALINEVKSDSISFFASQKFQADEELEIVCELNGEKILYQVVMKQLHEQISSGRIMTAVPSAEHPFPARTFYRCFAKVNSVITMNGPQEIETPADLVAAPIAAVSATSETTPIAETAPAAEVVPPATDAAPLAA
jgi:hypothetical protein